MGLSENIVLYNPSWIPQLLVNILFQLLYPSGPLTSSIQTRCFQSLCGWTMGFSQSCQYRLCSTWFSWVCPTLHY